MSSIRKKIKLSINRKQNVGGGGLSVSHGSMKEWEHA